MALLSTRVFIIDSEPAYHTINAEMLRKRKNSLEANEYGCVYSSVVCERFVAREEKASMIYSGQCCAMSSLYLLRPSTS